MEIQRLIHHALHGRAQVALPNQSVLLGHTLDVSIGGICILLQDQIPLGIEYLVRFEMSIQGKVHVVTAQTKSIDGVFANGGFRVGFAFKESDAQRSALINSLAGKKPMVDPAKRAVAPNSGQESPSAE